MHVGVPTIFCNDFRLAKSKLYLHTCLLNLFFNIVSLEELFGTLGHPEGVGATAIFSGPAWLSMRQYLDLESIFAKALG